MVRATLRPSRILAVALTTVHASTAATLIPLDFPLAVTLSCSAFVIASLCRSMHHYALLRSRSSIVALEIRDQEAGAVCSPDGVWHEAKILGTTYVTPRLTVINVRKSGARFASHVLLTSDNVDADDFRKVRVMLRWAKPKPAESLG